MVDIDDVSVEQLAGPAFEMPRRRSAGKTSDFLRDANARFVAALARRRDPLRGQLESRTYWLRELASSVTGAMELIESERAAARREQARGRVFLREGNAMEPYFRTRYGRVEYLLDREDLRLDRADAE